MNLKENAQLSLSDSESFHRNNWAMKRTRETSYTKPTKNRHTHYHMDPVDETNRYYYREKLCTSYSTPLSNSHYEDYLLQETYSTGLKEKNQFLREIDQVREEIVRFKTEMNGLAKQMDGMEIDLNHSKDRVHEIEKGLTATQEVNVNLQVLLERAVHKQKESDVYATRAMRHIHTNLATVVYETGQLRGRLTSIADYQKQHQGSVSDVAERMREYTYMLEQAQDTIHSLQEPSNRIRLLLSTEEEEMMTLDIRDMNNNTSTITSYSSSSDEDEEPVKPIPKTNNADLYRHRIIKKRESNPEVDIFTSPLVLNQKNQDWLPQKGLRILLNDYQGF